MLIVIAIVRGKNHHCPRPRFAAMVHSDEEGHPGSLFGHLLGLLLGFFSLALLTCLFLCFPHIVHLPKSKHKHQPENTQFDPNAHDMTP